MREMLHKAWLTIIKVSAMMTAIMSLATVMNFASHDHEQAVTSLYAAILLASVLVIVGVAGGLAFYRPLTLLRNLGSAFLGSAQDARREGNVRPIRPPRPHDDSTDHRRSA